MFVSTFNKYFVSDKRTITVFLTIGTLTTLLYFALFTVIWEILHIDYKMAVTISYLTALSFHFFMNRKITFQSSHGKIAAHIIKYAVMAFVNYLITLAIVEFSVKLLLLSPYLGVLISVGTTVVTGYFMSKLWVFKVVEKQI